MAKPIETSQTLTEEDLRENLSQVLDGLESRRRYSIVREGKEIGALTPVPSRWTQAELEAGYEALSADQKQEKEAEEWSEGIVGDMVDEPG